MTRESHEKGLVFDPMSSLHRSMLLSACMCIVCVAHAEGDPDPCKVFTTPSTCFKNNGCSPCSWCDGDMKFPRHRCQAHDNCRNTTDPFCTHWLTDPEHPCGKEHNCPQNAKWVDIIAYVVLSMLGFCVVVCCVRWCRPHRKGYQRVRPTQAESEMRLKQMLDPLRVTVSTH